METFQINNLLDFELEYELSIRGSATTSTVEDKRNILGRFLASETGNPDGHVDLIPYPFDFGKEEGDINRSFVSLEETITEFSDLDNPSTKDSVFQRIRSRLAHLIKRVRRLKKILSIPNKVDITLYPDIENFQSESLGYCFKLEADLYDCIKNKKTDPTIGDPTATPIINVAAPIVNCSQNQSNIASWNLKFNGNPKTLHSFLEKVEE